MVIVKSIIIVFIYYITKHYTFLNTNELPAIYHYYFYIIISFNAIRILLLPDNVIRMKIIKYFVKSLFY